MGRGGGKWTCRPLGETSSESSALKQWWATLSNAGKWAESCGEAHGKYVESGGGEISKIIMRITKFIVVREKTAGEHSVMSGTTYWHVDI